MALVTAPRTIRFGIRGFGGEIGDTVTRSLMAMNRQRFTAFQGVTGGAIKAFIRPQKGVTDLVATIMGDRSYSKLVGQGRLEDNTASSYGYTDHIAEVSFDDKVPGRVNVQGKDGRLLAIDYVVIPEGISNIPAFNEVDLLVDATGVGAKPKDVEKKPAIDPNLYQQYPNLTVFFSAPYNKTIKGAPHHLNGLHLASLEGQLHATGSCTTHAGVDLIRSIREPLVRMLGVAQEELVIEGGQLNTTHSLTPTDKQLQFYTGGFVPQTTGFGGAAKVVYPVAGIGSIDASTGRYYSYQQVGDLLVNGVSIFSLAMTISVRRGQKVHTAEEVAELIRQGLLETARDDEGGKHIGIISDAFKLDANKKHGLFTATSMAGMTKTTVLPLGDNIKVMKMTGRKVDDAGNDWDVYTVSVKNAAYDNRLGFTVDMLEEVNQVAQSRFGVQLIPGFHHQEDLGMELAFLSTNAGQNLFVEALTLTKGEIFVK